MHLSDASFVSQTDDAHHLADSPLLKLNIGLVTYFPIDYMHNVCLGVTRKLLNFWLSGNLQTRLPNRIVQMLSIRLVSLKCNIPKEINRKPRPLSELSRWKATELRTFLLYLGPHVLKDFVEISVYENFLLLHSAIVILISDSHILKFTSQLAKEFLNTFISHSAQIYGLEFLIYNVHMLCHLSDDVSFFGALDNFSSFPFENYLGKT